MTACDPTTRNWAGGKGGSPTALVWVRLAAVAIWDQARAMSSGPIPAGSPMVRAMVGRCSAMGFQLDLGDDWFGCSFDGLQSAEACD